MKKLCLVIFAIFAMTFAVTAQDVEENGTVGTEENTESTEPAVEYATVRGNVYYVCDNVGTHFSLKNVKLTLSDNTEIKTDSYGDYSFSWPKGKSVSISVENSDKNYENRDNGNTIIYVAPVDAYTIDVNDNIVYNLQLIRVSKADDDSKAKFNYQYVFSGGTPMSGLKVTMTPSLENVDLPSQTCTTDENGVVEFETFKTIRCEFVTTYPAEYNLKDKVVHGYLNFNSTVTEVTYTLPAFKCTIDFEDNTTSDPNGAPYYPNVILQFYDTEGKLVDNVADLNPSISKTESYQYTEECVAYKRYAGYKVRALYNGYYQTTDGDQLTGVKWSEVGSDNAVSLHLEKQACTNKLVTTIDDKGYIIISFPNHNLTLGPASDLITFTYKKSRSAKSSNNYSRTAVDNGVTLLAEEVGDGTIKLTRIFNDDDWLYNIQSDSVYQINIPSDKIRIDNYLYSWPLEMYQDIETGVFNVVEQGDAVVDVYTPAGLKVKTQVLESSLQEQLPAGVYIIRGAQKTYKLMLE